MIIMNKLRILFIALLTMSLAASAQKGKVVTAGTLMSSGEIVDAKKYIDEAFSDPEVAEMPKAWITKGQIYADVFKFQLAEQLQAPDALSIAFEAFKKGYELDMSQEKKPGRYVEEVRVGMFNTAVGLFEQAADQFNSEAYELSMANFKKSYDAVDWIETNGLAESGSEDNAIIKRDALTNAALCALNLQDYEKAAGFYETLIEMDAADDRTFANLASIYIVTGKYEDAKTVVDKGLAVYPDNESLKESELNYYIATDQADKAIGKLEDAIAANPTDPDLYFNVALAYEKLGEEEKMVAAYEKIMEIDPDYHGAYLNLGAYFNEKANSVIKTMNEMTDWKAAMKLEPERDNYYNRALPYLEKALELRPDDENVKRALERIYANLNMLDKVKEMRGEE